MKFLNHVNSEYHDIHQFNHIKPDSIPSLGLLHTNLASISKHFGDLNLVKIQLPLLVLVKIHKNDGNSIRNIHLDGYHPFVSYPTETSHHGTGFYIKESLVYVKRDDLKFNSPGNYESTIIEIILPDRKT